MKLLKIRGKNLASLVGEFALDFREGLLAEAGLFAITGETGAGKSTLLDALCLALYGRYPRQALVAGDRIEDVNGDELKGDQAGHILSKGQGHGYAEVEFCGQDGVEYRAHWEIKRAYGRPSGKLQAPKRSLERIGDGRMLADKVDAVGVEIRQRVGLSYDEFRRTALLAQGQFDAFLQAGENDRAELLEKITGTDLYQRISARVFELTKEKREAVEAKKALIGNVEVLEEEAKAGILANKQEWEAKAAAAQARQAEAARHLVLREDLTKRDVEYGRAEEEAERVGQRDAAIAGDRQLLAQLERVEPLRGKLHDWRQRREAWRAAEKNLTTKREQAEAAAGVARRAGEEELRSQQEAAARRSEVEAWEPLWEEAVRLDEAVRLARQEQISATREANQAGRKWREQEAELAAARQRIDAAEREVTEIGVRLEQEQWCAEAAANRAWIENLVKERLRVEAQWDGLEDRTRELAECQSELEQVSRNIGQVGNVWSAAQLAEREDRRMELSKWEAEGRQYQEALRQRNEAAGQLAREQEKLAGWTAELRDVENRGAELRARVEETSASAGSAALAAEQSVARLRERLQAGQKCPVCGSTEHPYHDADEQLRQLADEFRAREAALRRESASLEDKRMSLQTLASQAQGQMQVLREQQSAAEKTLQEKREVDEATLAGWQAELQRAGEEIRVQGGLIAERQRLLQVQVELTQRVSTLGQQQQQRYALGEELSGNERLLRPRVELCRGEWDVVRKRLEAWWDGVGRQIDEWTLARQEYDRKQQSLTEQRAGAEQMAQTVEAAGREAGERQRRRAVADEELAERQKARRELLGGEETEAHRERWHNLAETVERAAAEQKQAAGIAREGERQLRAQMAELEREQERCRESASAAERGWEEASAAAGVSGVEAQRLLDEVDAAALRGRVAAVDLELAQAQARLAQAREAREVAGRECAGLPEREELTRHRDEAEQGLQEALREVGAIGNALAENARREQRRAELGGELAGLEEVWLLWEEVNEAIGSKEGDKFRRFVQALTMDQLTALANHHLRNLAPRFELERSKVGTLGLQVRDAEFGGEVRAVAGLSGGERFLVSLGLALGLSGLEGKESFVDSLFIDEGFGTLDPEHLDLVMSGLEALRGGGRRVGIISHVEAMKERIAVQVRVRKKGSGRSVVEVAERMAGVGMVG
jgi:exonuclease SbcC